MSYSLACLRPDKFRAVSVQSGCGFDQVIGGMSTNNKGKTGGAAKPPGACKKTDSFSSSYMGIDPGAFLDPLLLGDKKPSPTMVCGTKAVPYMAFMGTCDGWIQYGRQGRDDFLRNNGCKPKVAQVPLLETRLAPPRAPPLAARQLRQTPLPRAPLLGRTEPRERTGSQLLVRALPVFWMTDTGTRRSSCGPGAPWRTSCRRG